jgi:uncharacterized protein YndB with AHSA1/START domain
MSNSLKITTPSDREIAMTRVFDAPRKLVFEAYPAGTPQAVARRLRRLGVGRLRDRPQGRRRVSI